MALPLAPARSCTITVTGASSGFLGVWVGQRYVPLDLLVTHHDWRAVDILVTAGRPVRLTDIGELAPISVAYAPEQPPTGTEFVDPFTVPPFMNAERFAITGSQLSIRPR